LLLFLTFDLILRFEDEILTFDQILRFEDGTLTFNRMQRRSMKMEKLKSLTTRVG